MNFTDFLFENTAARTETTLIEKTGVATFAELYHDIAALAGYLTETVGRGKNIPLMAENSRFFITAYLATMKSGNRTLPLDPAVSQSVLDHIIATSEPPLSFVQPRAAQKFEQYGHRLIGPDECSEICRTASADGITSAQETEPFDDTEVAEIIFTSGSTALPKGVMLTHKNLRANTESIISYLALTHRDRMLVVLPFFYCYGLSLLHTHIRVGGSIVLNNKFIFLQDVINDLNTYECTGFAGVPSHFQMLLRKSPTFTTTQFPHLRYVTQAGGKLPDPFIHEFREAFPEVLFYIMYGQTEATARLSYLPPELLDTKMGSMGRGIPGVTLEVIANDGTPVAPGDVGEIVASGDNIMLGYFNDPELTSATIPDGRLHTGDLATVDKDGFIFVVAREKEILKVGGERVSPKQIEDVIDSIPGVIDSSVIGVPDDILGEAIKAYVVLNPEGKQSVTEDYIRAYCGKKLTFQKSPKYVTFIDRIPVNAAGKKVKTIINHLESGGSPG